MNTAVKGYFCLVQYCPDIARLEAANIGVLLFSPEHQFLSARLSSDEKRVHRFFKGVADLPGHFSTMRSALLERLNVEKAEFRTLGDLERFVETRANKVILTAPKAVRVTKPEDDLDRLYSQLVAEPEGRHSVRLSSGPTLRRLLKDAFSSQELTAKIRRKISVEVPTLRRTLEVPYGYQNGRFNLIQPVSFPQKTVEAIAERACQYAVEGDFIYKHPNASVGEMQLIVVADFVNKTTGGREAVKDLLKGYHVKLFTPETLPELQDDIMLHGKTLV